MLELKEMYQDEMMVVDGGGRPLDDGMSSGKPVNGTPTPACGGNHTPCKSNEEAQKNHPPLTTSTEWSNASPKLANIISGIKEVNSLK